MDKKALIAAVAENTGCTKKNATIIVNETLKVITDTLAEGENVQLLGFGSFIVKERPARTGRNPFTKENIEIPAKKAVSFKASKSMKDAVAK